MLNGVESQVIPHESNSTTEYTWCGKTNGTVAMCDYIRCCGDGNLVRDSLCSVTPSLPRFRFEDTRTITVSLGVMFRCRKYFFCQTSLAKQKDLEGDYMLSAP